MSLKNLTIVIKLGTTLLTAGSNKLNQAKMLEVVRECAELLQKQYRIIIVTSGAIAAGREYLNYPELPNTIASKQLLAAVGQTQLILTWQRLFAIYNIHIGQMLLTRADLEDKERFLNAKDTLSALLDQQIIPVINENDAVVTSEIKVGDNDNLSALVAILAEADKLLILSDITGLYTADPHKDPTATLLTEIPQIDKQIRAMAGDSLSGLGTGGMATKIQSAAVATQAGIEVTIASGAVKHVIRDVADNINIGTRFLPQNPPLGSKKYWIFGAPIAGKIYVDAGAKSALENKGSLLPKGIVELHGNFSRGEVVLICDSSGTSISKGVARYNSDALTLIKGKYSKEISLILGYHYGDVAIHRDEMIIID